MIKFFLLYLNAFVLGQAFYLLNDPNLATAYNAAQSKPKQFIKKPITDKIRVMIIDSGFDVKHDLIKPFFKGRQGNKNSIFPSDFDYMAKVAQDHGTHVAGLVLHGELKRGRKPTTVCQEVEIIPCRIVPSGGKPGNRFDLEQFFSCYRKAIEYDVHYINISMSGSAADRREADYLYELQKDGITITIAAGNNSMNIDKRIGRTDNLAFPASYDMANMIIVGNGFSEKERYSTSNYGKTVDVWKNGVDILSTLPDNGFGIASGTSMAAPIYLNELINEDCKTLKRR